MAFHIDVDELVEQLFQRGEASVTDKLLLAMIESNIETNYLLYEIKSKMTDIQEQLTDMELDMTFVYKRVSRFYNDTRNYLHDIDKKAE